jgi:hypothetical protein
MKMREISGRKRFTRIYLWYSSDTCGSCHTFHPIPSPVRHYGLCVYSHVHIQPAVLGRGGMGECHAVLLPINTSPVYFTYKCSSTGFRVTYTVDCYTDDIPPPPDMY